jgi:hypothetical protein
MTLVQDAGPVPAELALNIKDRVAQRTRVQVQMLEIQVLGSRIVIHGCVPCYYLKQLVLQGVLDVVGSMGAYDLEFNVQVVASPWNSAQGDT